MYIYRQNDGIPWERCVATVGFFDGVHKGHRYLLNELQQIAQKKQMNSLVVTFNEHPGKILKSEFQPDLLTTLNEKLEILAGTGVDATMVLNFTKEMSQMNAFDFMQQILVEKLHIDTLLIGYDHRFGHNRSQGFKTYQTIGADMGMEVIQAKKFTTKGVKDFSSSEIRQCLLTGNVERASYLLSYPYAFTGRVVGGMKRGRKIGFPTANLLFSNKEKIIPAVGVYAVWVHIQKQRRKGMMNIGYNPTFHANRQLSIEVHIIDFEKDIYEQRIKIECVRFLREEIAFATVDELVKQLTADREKVINLDFSNL